MSTDSSFHLHRLYLLKYTLDTFICFPSWFKSLDSSSLLLLPVALACVLILSDQIWPRSLQPRPCLLPRAVLRRNFLKANLAQLPNSFSDAVMCVCFVWRQPSVFKLCESEGLGQRLRGGGPPAPHSVGCFTRSVSLTLKASEGVVPD